MANNLAQIQKFIEQLELSRHPGFRVAPFSSGYRNWTFGCKAGIAEPCVMTLAHDLGHAVDFGPKDFRNRTAGGSFHFEIKTQVEVAGQLYDEPITAQATERELRAYAYQFHLLELAGIDFDREANTYHASRILQDFMCDWACVPGSGKDERIQWCVDKTNQVYSTTSKAFIQRRLYDWLSMTNLMYEAKINDSSSQFQSNWLAFERSARNCLV